LEDVGDFFFSSNVEVGGRKYFLRCTHRQTAT
jgi:hypothetical protein